MKLNNCALQTCIEFNLSADSVWLVDVGTFLKTADEIVLTRLNYLFDIYEYDKGVISTYFHDRSDIKPKIEFPKHFYEVVGIGNCNDTNGDRLILIYKSNLKFPLSEIIDNDDEFISLLDTLNLSDHFYTILDFFFHWKMFRYLLHILFLFLRVLYIYI